MKKAHKVVLLLVLGEGESRILHVRDYQSSRRGSMPMHIQEAPMDSVGLEREYMKLLGEGVGGIGEKVEGSRWE